MRCDVCGIDHDWAPDWENMRCGKWRTAMVCQALANLCGVAFDFEAALARPVPRTRHEPGGPA